MRWTIRACEECCSRRAKGLSVVESAFISHANDGRLERAGWLALTVGHGACVCMCM